MDNKNTYVVSLSFCDYEAPRPEVFFFQDPVAARTKFDALCMGLSRHGYDTPIVELHFVKEGDKLWEDSQVIASFDLSFEKAWAGVQDEYRKKAYRLSRRKVPVKFEYLKIPSLYAA